MLIDVAEALFSIAKDPNHTTLLDSEGDAVLRCLDQYSDAGIEFRVSTAVLRLASSVFSNMFKPSFHQGQRLLNEDCPEFELEDDAHLMGLLLRILHYQEALGPWIPTWFRHSEGVEHPTDGLGFLVLAAYMFNDPMEFKAISRTAVLQLTPKFSAEWEKEELFSILPLRVIESLARRVQHILDGLETELQYVEHSLRGSSRCYDTWQLLCTQCGRSLPGNAKKCHPCRNTELPTKYCTSETRIAEYFEALRKAELWPTLGSFAACSVSDIASRFARARKGMRHTCEAGNSCSLVTSLDLLFKKAEEAQVGAVGLCLYCVRNDDGAGESGNCAHE
ncbi:hypothetical protein J3E71DRAFT_361123 [Bipolaris maydis]|nr:hypothetical protein J3E71DRAFT_361123 [Bipolaris maydis]